MGSLLHLISLLYTEEMFKFSFQLKATKKALYSVQGILFCFVAEEELATEERPSESELGCSGDVS